MDFIHPEIDAKVQVLYTLFNTYRGCCELTQQHTPPASGVGIFCSHVGRDAPPPFTVHVGGHANEGEEHKRGSSPPARPNADHAGAI